MNDSQKNPEKGEIWWVYNKILYGGRGLRPAKIISYNDNTSTCIVMTLTMSTNDSNNLIENSENEYLKVNQTYKIKYSDLSHLY